MQCLKDGLHGTAGHEDVERLERLIVKDFRNEARTHKERLMQNHRVRLHLDSMQQHASRLVPPPPPRPSFGQALPPPSSPAEYPCPDDIGRSQRTQEGQSAPLMQIETYADADGSRREDIAALKGDDAVACAPCCD